MCTFSTACCGHPDRPLGNTPSPVDRHSGPSSTDADPRSPSTGTFSRLQLTRVVNALGQRERPSGHSWECGGVPNPAPFKEIVASSFLFLPVAEVGMGHETENPGMLIARHRWWGGVLVSVDLGRCVCGGGASVVESAGDGGIVHTRDSTCNTRLFSERYCQLMHRCPREWREMHRRRTCGIDVRRGLTLTLEARSCKSSVNDLICTSFQRLPFP